MNAEGTDARAGQLPAPSDLIDVDSLLAAYHDRVPDISDPEQRVSFGTSGHRGTSLSGTFNEAHVAAISEAVWRYRQAHGIDGPLFLGRDTHALSEPALRTIVEVLGAHEVNLVVDAGDGATPTPVISHAILTHNRGAGPGLADGIVVTPSHNPPADGGFKYNPPQGGPAAADITDWIQREANRLLEDDLRDVRRVAYESVALHRRDYVSAYVEDLAAVIDLDVIRTSGLRLGVDPLGGASLAYWVAIAERHDLDLTVVSDALDPTFSFVPLDWDGKIRMDCSSPWAMSRLRARDFDVAFANDPDADRHGIVTPGAGLMNPNHFLATCVSYLFGGHRAWGDDVGVGKTMVSSSMIDHVAAALGRRLDEVPVGFKWFVPGLLDGTLGFGGEESAGASFLRRDGTVWTTDKDGLILGLLAAEMTATTGRDPGQIYEGLVQRFGRPAYRRIDVGASPGEKDVLKQLSADQVPSSELAGDPITEVLTAAPDDPDALLGGIKVVTERGWFAARPSGTEDVYKVYAESMIGEGHLHRILTEAEQIVSDALSGAGADAR